MCFVFGNKHLARRAAGSDTVDAVIGFVPVSVDFGISAVAAFAVVVEGVTDPAESGTRNQSPASMIRLGNLAGTDSGLAFDNGLPAQLTVCRITLRSLSRFTVRVAAPGCRLVRVFVLLAMGADTIGGGVGRNEVADAALTLLPFPSLESGPARRTVRTFECETALTNTHVGYSTNRKAPYPPGPDLQ